MLIFTQNFSESMHNDLKQIAIKHGHFWTFFHLPQDFEMYHDRYKPGAPFTDMV